jgi:hypothetical protein
MTPRPPLSADQELGLRNAGWLLLDVADVEHFTEVSEFSESLLNELEAIQLSLFDLASEVAEASLHELYELSERVLVVRRKLVNVVENLADLHDARPQLVDDSTFEEVDR